MFEIRFLHNYSVLKNIKYDFMEQYVNCENIQGQNQKNLFKCVICMLGFCKPVTYRPLVETLAFYVANKF